MTIEDGDDSAWKPSMSRRDADEWSRSSVYRRTIFHVTAREVEAQIREEGFDLNHRRFGRVWGNGIYATPDPNIASLYAQILGGNAALLALRINDAQVLSVRLPPTADGNAIRTVLSQMPDGLSRFIDLTSMLSRWQPMAIARAEAFTRTLTASGFDALELIQVHFTAAVGGTQVIVYDPRKVVIIND